MLEILEKSLLTAVGAMTLGQKKAEELAKELREKLNLTEEEGKAFMKKVQEAAMEGQQKLEESAHEEVKKACERMGVVSKEEFEKLKKDITQLKRSLTILEKKVKDAEA